MMRRLIEFMIQPRLEYASTVWSPPNENYKKNKKRIQRIATKMVPGLIGLPYEDWLMKVDYFLICLLVLCFYKNDNPIIW